MTTTIDTNIKRFSITHNVGGRLCSSHISATDWVSAEAFAAMLGGEVTGELTYTRCEKCNAADITVEDAGQWPEII